MFGLRCQCHCYHKALLCVRQNQMEPDNLRSIRLQWALIYDANIQYVLHTVSDFIKSLVILCKF